MARAANTAALAVRCAIYTRKSSEEGLDQDFNSLHAQREACEAYVKSQIGEGWRLLPDRYDDGGFSGGNMERPGLKQLLTDIDRGKIDIVVVYKVDRLTRSLSDFAKIVDRFDAKGASFVSVTQSFNTTTSMGRLTLNMLLSFAQFEREVTGERIRDKIAASKRKGMWMGGKLPLGYDADGRALKINETEAETVRHIFRRYRSLKSVRDLLRTLESEGVRSKLRTTRSGKVVGGIPFNRGALYHLLANRVYRGEIVHKEEVHPGLHPPIVDQDLFDEVQQMLAANRVAKRSESLRQRTSPLTGKLFDHNGEPLTPSIAYGRGGKCYRYYVSISLQTGGRQADPEELGRLAGPKTETYLAAQLRRIFGLPSDVAAPFEKLLRCDILADSVTLTLSFPPDEHASALTAISHRLLEDERVWKAQSGEALKILLPVRLRMRGGRVWRSSASGAAPKVKPRFDKALIIALRVAHVQLRVFGASPLQDPVDMRKALAPASSYHRRLVKLAFLAPDIQGAILEGRQPSGWTLDDYLFNELPLAWEEQRLLLG